ncbi:MAG: hypothetical protein A4E73_03486 [Syntrophaceae bacterium PtaU1.Bin231]|nr:MAG: hypothetical protein A4E73_03486 [Syntrophaceae bacterium PtaU1.Bin231]
MNKIDQKIFLARKITAGFLTHTPLLTDLLLKGRKRMTGRSGSLTTDATTSYCYAVWMRHLLSWHKTGARFPAAIAEIGPGNSLGVGLAALLCGVDRYHGLDTVAHMDDQKNEEIFAGLIELFRSRAPIPDHEEYPDLGALPSYRFPEHILSAERMKGALDTRRLDQIRRNLRNLSRSDGNGMIAYSAPWHQGLTPGIIGSCDWIFSQFVMEHVDDLPGVYELCHRLLRPSGGMSHHIDFRSHWTSYEWNGYWTYGDLTWKLIRGKRNYFINRAPLSEHIACMKTAGFGQLEVQRTEGETCLTQKELASRFRSLTKDDLQTMFAIIIARKL